MTSAGSRGRHLAHGASADVAEWSPAGLSPVDAARASMVVKVHRGAGARRKALAEAAALSSVDHPHIVRLRGLHDDGTVGLLLPRLSSVTARHWLGVRSPLPPGEAVTLLVPLLRALAHIERRGIDRTVGLVDGVDLDDVLFDERGAPIITSLRGTIDDPARPRRWPGGAIGAAFRLVEEVAAHIDAGTDRADLDALLAAPGASIDEMIETVFALAAPEPLMRVHDEADVDSAVPMAVAADTGRSRGGLEPVVASWRRIIVAAREIRPKVWVTSAIIGISAVAGVIAASTGPTGPPQSQNAQAPSDAPRRASAATGSDSPSTPAADETPSLAGEPDAAFPVLLRLRAACLRALDGECVAGVDETESPVLAGDRAAIESPRLLDDLPVDLTPGAVVNRLGGAVLFQARDEGHDRAATVLLTRTETGWRLRDIVVDAPDDDE